MASDLQINRFCEKFIKAKMLYDMNQVSSILETEYIEMGLLDERALLFNLEKIWAEFRNGQQADRISNKQRTKWNRIL